MHNPKLPNIWMVLFPTVSFKAFEVLTHQSVSQSIQLLKNALFCDIWIRFENSQSFKSQIMLGTNLRCLDNLKGIWGFDTSNSLQTTSLCKAVFDIPTSCSDSHFTWSYVANIGTIVWATVLWIPVNTPQTSKTLHTVLSTSLAS